MRFAFAPILVGLSLLSSGCALLEDGTRNTVLALRTPIAEHREVARNQRWAEDAWNGVCSAKPGPYSVAYAHGFKDGYAEFLFRGGDGEPPLVAPPYYRRLQDQTPEGFAAIQDWFHGYRHGASVARDSGARQWVTGPSALPVESHESMAETFQPPAPVPASVEIQTPTVSPAATPAPAERPSAKSREPKATSPSPILPTAPAPAGSVLLWDNTPAEPCSHRTGPCPPSATRIRIIGVRTGSGEVEPEPLRARITGITLAPPAD